MGCTVFTIMGVLSERDMVLRYLSATRHGYYLQAGCVAATMALDYSTDRRHFIVPYSHRLSDMGVVSANVRQ